jgi:large subunit ribosomal protein L29
MVLKAKELRELSDDELQQQLHDKQEGLFNLRIQMATGSMDNVRAQRNARRDIARILTVVRERELAAEKDNAMQAKAETT